MGSIRAERQVRLHNENEAILRGPVSHALATKSRAAEPTVPGRSPLGCVERLRPYSAAWRDVAKVGSSSPLA